jgi:hypothetical protein
MTVAIRKQVHAIGGVGTPPPRLGVVDRRSAQRGREPVRNIGSSGRAVGTGTPFRPLGDADGTGVVARMSVMNRIEPQVQPGRGGAN